MFRSYSRRLDSDKRIEAAKVQVIEYLLKISSRQIHFYTVCVSFKFQFLRFQIRSSRKNGNDLHVRRNNNGGRFLCVENKNERQKGGRKKRNLIAESGTISRCSSTSRSLDDFLIVCIIDKLCAQGNTYGMLHGVKTA